MPIAEAAAFKDPDPGRSAGRSRAAGIRSRRRWYSGLSEQSGRGAGTATDARLADATRAPRELHRAGGVRLEPALVPLRARRRLAPEQGTPRAAAHGRVTMTTSAIAAVAGRAVEESFGVVDQAGRRRGAMRLLARKNDPASASARPTAASRSSSTSSSTTASTSPRSRSMVPVARHLRGTTPHGPDVKAVDVHVDSARRAE